MSSDMRSVPDLKRLLFWPTLYGILVLCVLRTSLSRV